MAGRTPPRKVTYFEPVPPRLARDTVIGRRSRSAGASAARCASTAVGSIPARSSGRSVVNGTPHA